MDGMPHVNPKFDAARVLREPELRALGFAPVAGFWSTAKSFG